MIPMNDANDIAWTAETATKGSMKMSEVFNYGTECFAGSDAGTSGNYWYGNFPVARTFPCTCYTESY